MWLSDEEDANRAVRRGDCKGRPVTVDVVQPYEFMISNGASPAEALDMCDGDPERVFYIVKPAIME